MRLTISSCFNPRARAGRDLAFFKSFHFIRSFNPRARAGRDTIIMLIVPAFRFQSTRPRGARRALDWLCYFIFPVSIHAPARGATINITSKEEDNTVSIHAPARGATTPNRCRRKDAPFQSTRPRGARLSGVRLRLRLKRFNPRARAGRDQDYYFLTPYYIVSIHAPARGAT